jgi:hypothetical protein
MLQFVFNIHTLRVKLILLRFLRRDKCRRISHCRLSVCQSRILILPKPIFNAQKESALSSYALHRSPTKGFTRIHEEKMRPDGRILTYMLFVYEIFGRISVEQLVSVDAKL